MHLLSTFDTYKFCNVAIFICMVASTSANNWLCRNFNFFLFCFFHSCKNLSWRKASGTLSKMCHRTTPTIGYIASQFPPIHFAQRAGFHPEGCPVYSSMLKCPTCGTLRSTWCLLNGNLLCDCFRVKEKRGRPVTLLGTVSDLTAAYTVSQLYNYAPFLLPLRKHPAR